MQTLLIVRSITRLKRLYELGHAVILERELNHLIQLLGDYDTRTSI